MKVLCAGYPKTGTKSMREALAILGYENTHDFFEQLAYDSDILNKALFDNNATIVDIKAAYADVDSITDVPGIYLWEDILKAFPDCKVILTVRNTVDEWKKSFVNMMKAEVYYKKNSFALVKALFWNRMCPVLSHFFKYYQYLHRRLCPGYDVEIAKKKYLQHNKRVIKGCQAEQLLIFNVNDGWSPLCKFLEKEVPNSPFPHKNKKHSFGEDFRKGKLLFDGGMLKKIQNEFIRIGIIYLLFFILAIVVFRNYFL